MNPSSTTKGTLMCMAPVSNNSSMGLFDLNRIGLSKSSITLGLISNVYNIIVYIII